MGDFKHWYEDRDHLSVEKVFAAVDGAESGTSLKKALFDTHIGGNMLVFKQGRDYFSKTLRYAREAWRYGEDSFAYAQTGPVEGATVAGGVLAGLALLWLALKGLRAVCKATWDSIWESDDALGME